MVQPLIEFYFQNNGDYEKYITCILFLVFVVLKLQGATRIEHLHSNANASATVQIGTLKSGLPAGVKTPNTYGWVGESGHFWSSTAIPPIAAWSWGLYFSNSSVQTIASDCRYIHGG